MKFRLMNTKNERGLLIARFQTPTGQSVIVKGRRSGSIMYVNPPPEDNKCEICRQDAENLEAFNEQFSEALMTEERIINGMIQRIGRNSSRSITADHKLAKHFRFFTENESEASWECKACYTLSDQEASEARNGRNRPYH